MSLELPAAPGSGGQADGGHFCGFQDVGIGIGTDAVAAGGRLKMILQLVGHFHRRESHRQAYQTVHAIEYGQLE